MPFKSRAQMKKFFVMEKKGELPKGVAKEWASETPNINKLPEHKNSSQGRYHERNRKG